jgi:hypothetical protein
MYDCVNIVLKNIFYLVDNERSCRMENVFGYFLAIGSGLAMGFIIVLLPAAMIWNRMQRRKQNNARY